jgi:hypothetical protein
LGRALLAGHEPILALLLRGGRDGAERRGEKDESRQEKAQTHRVWVPGQDQKRVPKPKRTTCVWS